VMGLRYAVFHMLVDAAYHSHNLHAWMFAMYTYAMAHLIVINHPFIITCSHVVAQPVHCGCFGSSPESPHVWFNFAVFVAYARAVLEDGVFSTGKK
jgi:hypothetical protein